MRKVRILGAVTALVLMANPVAPGHAVDVAPTTLYFHSATPVGNVDHQQANFFAGDFAGTGTYMDATAPTKSEPSVGVSVTQGVYPNASIYGPAWRAAAKGTLSGDATVTFWADGAANAFDVNLYVDENIDNDAYAPIATKRVSVPTGTPEPREFTAAFSGLNTAVHDEVIVQITPVFEARDAADLFEGDTIELFAGDANVFYDSVDYPSRITLTVVPPDAEPPPPPSNRAYELYRAPLLPGSDSDNELSIGVNPETNTAMILMSLATASVTWDDTVSPPKATWTDVSHGPTSTTTVDPYLFTDRATGRTFVQQLVGEASLAAYTDDDGKTWTTTNPPSSAPSFDHESVAAGPYPAGHEVAGNAYGRAVYYCAQGLIMGGCTRSDDGGMTWNMPSEFSFLGNCLPSHGRVLVDDAGIVYLPVEECLDGGGQGLFISRDAGVTWEEHEFADIPSGNSDPVVTVDGAGKLYFTGTTETGDVLVATSNDRGLTWSEPVNVGALAGVALAEFPMAVSGDAGRTAISFYGSKDPGDSQDPEYKGEWHIYAATSTDGGQTWTVQDITPGDPVQRGWICLSGTTCDSGRNLLDFQGMTMDNAGRALIAYADGCTTAACHAATNSTNAAAGSTDSHPVIARQMTGSFLKG